MKKKKKGATKQRKYDANVCPTESANDIVNLKTG